MLGFVGLTDVELGVHFAVLQADDGLNSIREMCRELDFVMVRRQISQAG